MKSAVKKVSTENPFLDLTWTDIQDWAGSKILSRGRSYQKSDAVRELGITKKNELIAWVDGSTRYATKVNFKQGNLFSECTCPYKINCKHGVAVVIEYLALVKLKKDVPVLAQSDPRISLVKSGKTSWANEPDDDQSDFFEDENEDYNEGDEVLLKKSKPKKVNPIDEFINNRTKEELVAIVMDIASSYPEIMSDLSLKAEMSTSSVNLLTKIINKEIDSATSEPDYNNHWDHFGYTPDYSRVQTGLQKLYDTGNFDEVITLGKKLLKQGIEQIEQGDDGQIFEEVSDSLSIVFQALAKCSLSNVGKMELAIEWELADDYSLTDGLEKFWKDKFSKRDWSTLADCLLDKLKNLKQKKDESEFSRNYYRDKLTTHIIDALERSGRLQEKTDLCIREAVLTKSYDRLVTMLINAGNIVDAEKWIRKGIEETQKESPGIASKLRTNLFEIYSNKKDWLFCAALKADDFLNHPSLEKYKELKMACEKAKIWNSTRPGVILFLNNGTVPKGSSPQWQLPKTGLTLSSRNRFVKLQNELIEIALFEQDIDEALRLYDETQQLKNSNSPWGLGWNTSITYQVAEAIKEKYPERSVSIWKKVAEHHTNRTGTKEYQIALGFLRRIQKVMIKTGKGKEFTEYVADMRNSNKRKPRLVEMLDGLNGRKIVDE
jgi:uncharacterized Zn finger protein